MAVARVRKVSALAAGLLRQAATTISWQWGASGGCCPQRCQGLLMGLRGELAHDKPVGTGGASASVLSSPSPWSSLEAPWG
eukprot:jgi/Mesen1/5517/ME000279S04722